MALVTINFESQYLGNNHEVGIILPDKPRGQSPKEFYGNGKKYKVLWLLHGTFGDYSDWIRKSKIELYACERDLIVVMPSALNSFYSDWPTFATGFAMESYLFNELMPLIYGWFPASDKREDNYIAGLSMGGTGASKYAINFPEYFAGAIILSRNPRPVSKFEYDNGYIDARINNSVNNAGGLEAYKNSNENAWDKLKDKVKTGELPKFYLACGEDDGCYPEWLEFKAYCESLGWKDATFVSEPGYRHEWRFWDKYIEKGLDFFQIGKDKDAGNPF